MSKRKGSSSSSSKGASAKKKLNSTKYETSKHNANVGVAASNAKLASKFLANQKRGVDTEISYSEGNVVATTTDNANIVLINGIKEGDGIQNRQNRKIVMKSVRVKGSFRVVHFNAAALFSNEARLTIIYDKTPRTTLPKFDEIFGCTYPDGTEVTPAYSATFCLPKLDNLDRFTILRDKVMDFDVTATPGTTSLINYGQFDEYVRLPAECQEAAYLSNSSPMTVADIQSGALYVLVRGAINTGTTSQVSIVATARLRFY